MCPGKEKPASLSTHCFIICHLRKTATDSHCVSCGYLSPYLQVHNVSCGQHSHQTNTATKPPRHNSIATAFAHFEMMTSPLRARSSNEIDPYSAAHVYYGQNAIHKSNHFRTRTFSTVSSKICTQSSDTDNFLCRIKPLHLTGLVSRHPFAGAAMVGPLFALCM